MSEKLHSREANDEEKRRENEEPGLPQSAIITTKKSIPSLPAHSPTSRRPGPDDDEAVVQKSEAGWATSLPDPAPPSRKRVQDMKNKKKKKRFITNAMMESSPDGMVADVEGHEDGAASIPTPPKPLSQTSQGSVKSEQPTSLEERSRGYFSPDKHHFQDRSDVEITERVHQEMEDGRTTPSLPQTPTTPLVQPSMSSDVSANHWHGTTIEAAIDAAKTTLFVTLTSSKSDMVPKTATLNLATAQRLVLADFQRRLTNRSHVIISTSSGSTARAELSALHEDLRDYCTCLRDLEYMQGYASRHAEDDEQDPFYLKSSKQIERLAMEEVGLVPDFVLPKGQLPKARDCDDPRLPGVSRTVAHRSSETEQLWVRFGMASAGGLILVVPMLIMANLGTKTANLVTTCIAMFVFAVGVTFSKQLKPDQVLGITAAYAAVLVVFVGTSFST